MSRTYGDRSDAGDKLRILKKQTESLKRENARLQKELRAALQAVAEARNMLGDEESEEVVKKKRKGEELCTECNKGTYVEFSIKLPNSTTKTYLTCNACRHRKLFK
jgi:hypothetical protein